MTAAVAPRFPRSPEELEPSWVHRVLLPFFPDLPEIEAVRCERIGTGQMGCNVRVHLDYGGHDAVHGPTTVVCKFASNDPTSRATGLALRSYEIETNFLPPGGVALFVAGSAMFLRGLRPRVGEFVIVLEDVAKAEPGDQLAPCTVAQARSALDALAAIHAVTWENKALAELDWLNRRDEEQRTQLIAFFQAAAPAFLDRYRASLEARHVRVLEEFAPRMPQWLELARGPHALVHGDFRPDNLLFLRSRAAPYRTLVVDWQTVSWGPPVADATYFIGGAFEPRERRRYEGDLLLFYWEGLRRRGVRELSFLRCVEDHSIFAFGGLVMAVAAAILVERTARGDEMFLTMFARHAQHALDLGALSIFEPRRLAKLREQREPVS